MNVKTLLLTKFAELLDGPLTLSKVIAIIAVAHGNQEDKGGNAYVRHCLRVMEQLDKEDDMICGVSHDVVEDTDLTLGNLEELGFTHGQIKVIAALTKTPGLSHEDYISGIEKSPLATEIKILDMRDNSRLDRLKNITLTEKDMKRYQKYIHDLHRLGGLRRKA